jgi:FkbM family methyltransferase
VIAKIKARLAALHGRAALEMARIGDGAIGRLQLFLLYAIGEAWWPKGRAFRLRLRAMGRPFTCVVDDYTQVLVLREVFWAEDYRLDDDFAPATILDLGSNIGASIIYFRLRYPQARIIGLEPDPAAFARLQGNIAPFDGIEVVNAAVASFTGELALHRYPGHSWGSSVTALWGESPHRVTVPTHSLDDLLREFELDSIDLLKIDIEGAEWDVLPAFHNLDRVRTIIGEIHRSGDEPLERLLETLHPLRISVGETSHQALRFVARRK